MLHIALCDDERRFMQELDSRLRVLFSQYSYEIETQLFSDGKILIDEVDRNGKAYDLIFLDIQMPEIDGFSTAEILRKIDNDFNLIFITQTRTISKQAFKYNVFRYIDKDSLDNDLHEAVEEYLEKTKKLALSEETVVFTCTYGKDVRELPIKKKDILYLEVIKRRVCMFTRHHKYEMQTYPLRYYLDKLGNEHFAIVYRKYCINLAHVVSLQDRYFLMSNGMRIYIGTTEKSKEEITLCYGKYRRGVL